MHFRINLETAKIKNYKAKEFKTVLRERSAVMSAMRKLSFAPTLFENMQSFIRLCEALRIKRVMSKLLMGPVELFLGCKYGKEFRKTRIGTVVVQGVSFNFYDPTLSYLLQFAYGETYEPAVTHHIKALIQNKNVCFLDIGAHFGFYTAYIAALNPKTEIHSFEPNSEYFCVMRRNMEINNINAKTYKIALSDTRKQIPFSGRSMKVSDKKNMEIVESVTFDELSKKNNIKPDIVKIDVHGGEGKVLFGMKNALRDCIKHLYLEIHPNEFLVDYSIKDIIDLLKDLSFELFEINCFRNDSMPEIAKISDEDYDNLINQNKWTQGQINNRRMIYAKKFNSSVL